MEKGILGARAAQAKVYIGKVWWLEVGWFCRRQNILEIGSQTGTKGETRVAGEGAGAGVIR